MRKANIVTKVSAVGETHKKWPQLQCKTTDFFGQNHWLKRYHVTAFCCNSHYQSTAVNVRLPNVVLSTIKMFAVCGRLYCRLWVTFQNLSRHCMKQWRYNISTNVPKLTVCMACKANAVIKLSAAWETHKNDHHHNARKLTSLAKPLVKKMSCHSFLL